MLNVVHLRCVPKFILWNIWNEKPTDVTIPILFIYRRISTCFRPTGPSSGEFTKLFTQPLVQWLYRLGCVPCMRPERYSHWTHGCVNQLCEFSWRWACMPETCRDPSIYEWNWNSDICWFFISYVEKMQGTKSLKKNQNSFLHTKTTALEKECQFCCNVGRFWTYYYFAVPPWHAAGAFLARGNWMWKYYPFFRTFKFLY
jgi:hypothetical protein